ncbi:MAG: sulfite exporter TauE/SafE family protein [Actinobacteria bacterium]|nr:sulfite exporter TauE/SafE family protein [Actinomycetota bacterium]
MLVTLLAFITGILVGLTGTGAGVILTPLLLLVTPFHALTVIGTDLMSGAVTKLAGVLEHRKLGQVRSGLAVSLLAGSVPGSLAGIVFIRLLSNRGRPGRRSTGRSRWQSAAQEAVERFFDGCCQGLCSSATDSSMPANSSSAAERAISRP